MNWFKALIPDFQKKDTQEPKNKLHLILCGIMIICVFLPWIRYSTLEVGGKVSEIVSDNILGITTWYGIAALATALVAALGIYLNQYALTFWGCIAGAVFGLIGANSYADIKIEDYVIFKEQFEALARAGGATYVNHIGAKLFIMASCLLAGFSCVKIFSSDDTKEETLLSKIIVGLAAFICAAIAIDAIIIRPTFISYITTNIYSWGLLNTVVILLTYSYYLSNKENKSNKSNMAATVLLAVAFLFSNANASQYKASLNRGEFDEIRAAKYLQSESYDDRDEQREIEKKTEDAYDDELIPTRPGQQIEKRSRDRDRDRYDDDDYDYDYEY